RRCTMEQVEELREKVLSVLLPWGVKRIAIFGSVVRGEDRPESDIDILVELEKPIGWKFFSLEIYLEKIFGRKIDLVTKNALKEQIKESILNQVKYV
ncbi:MAG: nucleotidyltransferase family protein, partial [Bacteroidales bacterium]|nr:nucleotidyltransferase family protein [Bacteroidales bacterium]